MRKKLAIVTTHPIQYNAPLFSLLSKRGYIEVRVFYTWGTSALENKYDPGFGRVISWDIPLLEGYESEFLENDSKSPGSHHFKGVINPDIIPRIDAYAPDAILVYGWSYSAHLKVMRHYKGRIPVLFRGDSTLLDDRPGLRSMLRKTYLTWVYSHVDKAFYAGTNNKAYFSRAGLPENKLIEAFHAVDNDFFLDRDDCYQQKAKKWRGELGIPQDAVVFLFAGKMEAKKSPEILLQAFQALSFPTETHLVMVGNGNLENGLKKRAAGERTVHFVDFQNQKQMPVVYRLGNIFVLPSDGPGETWGLAINEAMASGRPVIASSKCGGAVDLVQNGLNGYIFKAGDPNDLREKMLAMVNERTRLREMGNKAFMHIQQFSLPAIAEKIEKAVIG
jgi:glycosyltransferase involved in cell wall biosynthesis